MNKGEISFVQGALGKKILKFVFPLIIAYLIQQAYNSADLISSSKKAADKQSASNYGRAIQNAIATCLAKGTEISDATYDINNITNDCLNSSIEINGKPLPMRDLYAKVPYLEIRPNSCAYVYCD